LFGRIVSWGFRYVRVSTWGRLGFLESGETVVHVLVDCPNLRELRQELRDKIGDAFNDISAILGGKPQDIRRRKGWSINAGVVDAVLDFAQASQRFQSREVDWSQIRDRR
jgi:hypothetical protein